MAVVKLLEWCFLLTLIASVTCQEKAPPTEMDSNLRRFQRNKRAAENCICVPFDQCINDVIVSDGSQIIHPRKKRQASVSPRIQGRKYAMYRCPPYLICCQKSITTTPRPTRFLKIQSQFHKCGIRNPAGINGRILFTHSSGKSDFAEWPWQAAVLQRDGNVYRFMCGGTLIDQQHVLTAAHCAKTFQYYINFMVVRLGEWDAENFNEYLPSEEYDVLEIFLHPQYSSRNLFNDIAILKLHSTVTYQPHIDAVCLPHDEDDFTDEDCVVTGWGKNSYKDGNYSMIMKELSVTIVGNEDCEKMLQKTFLGKYFKLHQGFLCASGKENENPCNGDDGGPLVCKRYDNSYAVVGLVSWGIECGYRGVPEVYTNVQKYISWISAKTGKPLREYWNDDED